MGYSVKEKIYLAIIILGIIIIVVEVNKILDLFKGGWVGSSVDVLTSAEVDSYNNKNMIN